MIVQPSRLQVSRTVAVAAALVALAYVPATAGEKVLYSFTGGTDGGGPSASLTFDGSGNLYGTTHFGGITTCGGIVGGGCGTVFELTPTASGSWTESVLYAFADGTDGGFPNAGVLLDGSGNVYGTASTGGGNACALGCGVIFQLVNSGGWSENVLHTFVGSDGQFPNAGFVVGPGFMLYSTTSQGGASGNGTVFREFPAPDGGWTETVLHSFDGKNGGSKPTAGVIQDRSGNFYGTTYPSDSYNGGIAYQLTLGSNGKYTEHVLHAFGSSNDGSNPYAGLIIDNQGNLYGTTINGGANGGGGIVYELIPRPGKVWREKVLHSFGAAGDGSQPYGGLLLDRGNLYGTTVFGGAHGFGAVYELRPSASGGYTERVLHSFTGKQDGAYPSASLIADKAGNLYGTASNGGGHKAGVVFELVR